MKFEWEKSMNIFEDYDLSYLDAAAEGVDIDFSGLLSRLVTGNSEGVFYELFTSIVNNVFSEVIFNKEMLIKIIIIAAVSALFANMSGMMDNREIAETSFYITYVMMVTLVTSGFYVTSQVVNQAVSSVIAFMSALIPAFCLSVGLMGESAAAAGFSSLLFLMLWIFQNVMQKILIPAVNVCVVISLINKMSEHDYFSQMAKLIKSAVNFTLKAVTAFIAGTGTIQAIAAKAADSAGKGLVFKVINALPMGNTINAAGNIISSVSGSIKNAFGAAGLMVVCLICLVPAARLLILDGMYRVTAALMQPVADRRITGCIEVFGGGVKLLYNIIICCAMTVFAAIGVICVMV